MKNEVIKVFQTLVTELSQSALNHEIHSRIFAAEGFSKLAQKYGEHAKDEREFVAKFIDRIIDLGGEIKQEATDAWEVKSDFMEFLKQDLKTQEDGVKMLAECLKKDFWDVGSYEIIKEYYLDEEGDLFWSQAQCELIEKIGLQNYLTKQI